MKFSLNTPNLKEMQAQKWFKPVMFGVIAILIILVLTVVSSTLNKRNEEAVSSKKNSLTISGDTSISTVKQSVYYTGKEGSWQTIRDALTAFRKENSKYTLLVTSHDITNNSRHYEFYAGTEVTDSNYTNYTSELSFDITLSGSLDTSTISYVSITFAKDNKTKPVNATVKVYLSLLDAIMKGIYPDADSNTLSLIKKDLAVPSATDYIKIKNDKENFVEGMDFKSGEDNKNVSTFNYFSSNNSFVYEYRVK